jgi:hypothetical protein
MNMRTLFFVAVSLAFGLVSTHGQSDPAPLPNAHAHNDYEHPRPLLDALAQGFCSVEADIYLVQGKLLVAHDRENVSTQRTLESLYLDPLRERIKQNGGNVFLKGPPFTLLIDIKSEAEPTYAALREVLRRYADLLTQFRSNATEVRAITVILSGNRPQATVASEPLRYAAIDGRLPDLEGGESRHLIPLISDNWSSHFQWRGVGPMPAEEKQSLQQIVARTHQQGRRLRFWAAPDQAAGWRELKAAGVDLINTDDLAGLRQFFSTP